MYRLFGFMIALLVLGADLSSAQSMTYVDGARPGASQISNHQRFMGTQRRTQARRFAYQRTASHRQRMSVLNQRNVQRTLGRGARTGISPGVVAQKRQQIRDRRMNQMKRRFRPVTQSSRLEQARTQRAESRRRATQRRTRRTSRTLNW